MGEFGRGIDSAKYVVCGDVKCINILGCQLSKSISVCKKKKRKKEKENIETKNKLTLC